MTELDEVYVRAKGLWLEDPEKLEHEQPLLARAFQEHQKTDQTPALQAYETRLQRLELELRRERLMFEEQQAASQGRERRLKDEWEAERRRAHGLVAELEEVRRQLAWAKRKPKITPEEASVLSGIGVSKGLAPD